MKLILRLALGVVLFLLVLPFGLAEALLVGLFVGVPWLVIEGLPALMEWAFDPAPAPTPRRRK